MNAAVSKAEPDYTALFNIMIKLDFPQMLLIYRMKVWRTGLCSEGADSLSTPNPTLPAICGFAASHVTP